VTAPIDVLLSFVLGGAVALAARIQLRLSPRPWYATRYFASLGTLYGFLVVPAASYRYFLHPDWSAMYMVDVAPAQQFFGLGALLAVMGSGLGAFVLGNYCARAHREWILLASLAAAAGGIAMLAALGAGRIGVVGSHAQWTGTFGLREIGETDLLPAMLIMGLFVVGAWVHVLVVFAREGTAVRSASR